MLAVVLPELTPAALDAAKPVVDACPAGEENLPVRWAALLGALGETDTRRVLKRLRCSNACIEETAVLVRETAGEGVSEEKASAHPGDIHIRQLLGRYGLCTVERLCALCAALHPQNTPDCALAAQRARQLEADGVCCRVSQLAVNGRDLMAAGIPAGPALRRVLEALLDGVIRAEYPNEKPALLAAAQKIIAS